MQLFKRAVLAYISFPFRLKGPNVNVVYGRIFLVYFLIFLANAGGHLYSSDEETMYSTTESMVKYHQLALPSSVLAGNHILSVVPGRDGQAYGVYGLMPSLVAIPLYMCGQAVAPFYPEHYRPYISRLFVSFTNNFVTAATCLLLFVFAMRLFESRMVAHLLVAAYALGSPAFQYAKTFFSEPLCTALLLLTAYLLFVAKEVPATGTMFSAGLAFGGAVLTKIPTLIFLPIVGSYVLFWPTRSQWIPIIKRALAFATGVSLPVVVYMMLEYKEFGYFIGSPYSVVPGINFRTPLYFGLHGLLFSSGKGLLFYFPLLLLFPPAFMKFKSKYFAEAILFLGIGVTDLLFYSTYSMWYGGNCWGPRFLFYSLPFLALPLGVYLCELRKNRFSWCVFAVLFVASVYVQMGGSLIFFNQYISTLRVPVSEYASGYQGMVTMHFNPKYSPIVGHWKLAVRDWKHRDILRHYLNEPKVRPVDSNSVVERTQFQGREAPFVWTHEKSEFLLLPGNENFGDSYFEAGIDDSVPVPPNVHFDVNGNSATSVGKYKEGRLTIYRFAWQLPAHEPLSFTIHSNVWVPAEHLPGSQDHRHLGVALYFVRANGRLFSWGDWDGHGVPSWATPPPTQPDQLFGWFWLPTLDFWWLYCFFAGLSIWFIVETTSLVILMGILVAFAASRFVPGLLSEPTAA